MKAALAASRWGSRGQPTLMLAGFAVAVAVRITLGGVEVRTSPRAGLVFAGCLAALSVAGGVRVRPTRRAAVIGIAGGAVLCLPALTRHLVAVEAHRPAGSFLRWAVVICLVAAAEELFLRGALFDAIAESAGALSAVALTALCFGLLHVPLYGWSAVPLDVAAGVWLGILRLEAASPTAPMLAHVLADLAGWWLR